MLRQLEKIETAEQNRKRRAENSLGRIPKKQKPNGGGGDKTGRPGGDGGGGDRARTKKLCALCQKYGGAATTHYTDQCKKWTSDGKKKPTFKSKGNSGGGPKKSWKKSFLTLSRELSELTNAVKKGASKRKRKRADCDDLSDDE